MSMSIKTNVSSLEAQKNLMNSENDLNKSLAKLSSGYRITKAQDDAAGLAIAVNLGAQIKSYNQAVRNANDALNVSQTAEASLNETQNILTRLRELASQSASSGISNTERGYVQNETDALTSEIDRIANSTEYNGVALLNASTALTFQVGIRNVANNDQITVTTSSATAASLGINGLSLATLTGAQGALATIDAALQSISSNRATLGAQANRMETVINAATQASVSLSAAQSRIQDVDVAQETSNLSRAQILMQAGVSVLAQSNQIPQVALKLLG
ncbi:MAG: flagellin [Myxococcales bacterium]|jgi:flagellin|nr:flagellin [Myxococcales bacterium]